MATLNTRKAFHLRVGAYYNSMSIYGSFLCTENKSVKLLVSFFVSQKDVKRPSLILANTFNSFSIDFNSHLGDPMDSIGIVHPNVAGNTGLGSLITLW